MSRHKKLNLELVPDFETSFGQRLALERARLGMTQDALGGAAGITGRAIARYESGSSTVRDDVLEAFGEIGVDLAYLFYGAQQHRPYDRDVYQLVRTWADESLVDSAGRPIPHWERLQRMIKAYRWVVEARTAGDRAERMGYLRQRRVA